jgi:hypothetical protein
MGKEKNDDYEQLDIFSLQEKQPLTLKATSIPEGVKLKENQLWCPYCNAPYVFKKDKKLKTANCPDCSISTRDFYVRKINKLK